MPDMRASDQPEPGSDQTGDGDTARAASVMELSTTEAAHRHGVTPATVRRWAAAGKIPARRPGRDWLIREESA
jgi:excisionase family DNA binding protein